MDKSLERKSIWVTGGAGYVGANVCAEIVRRGLVPIVIDDLSSGFELFVKSYPQVRDSIIDMPALRKSLLAVTKQYGAPRAVIHLAAKTDVSMAELYPAFYFETNVMGTFNIAHLADEFGCKRFIFASSAAVYGNLGTLAADARMKYLKPIGVYGETKLEAEKVLQKYFPQHRLSILRYFNIAGAGVDKDHNHLGKPQKFSNAFFSKMVRALHEKQVFHTVIDKKWHGLGRFSPIRDFIHVSDVAKATVARALVGNPGETEIYNIGRGVPVRIADVPTLINKNLLRCETVRLKHKEGAPRAASDIFSSVAKLRADQTYFLYRDLVDMFASERAWQLSDLFKSL